MPIPVIIDTDPGVDDMVALLYALASPEIEIVGIVVSFGNTDLDASFKNVLKLYGALSRHFAEFPDDENRFPNFRSKPFLARGAAGPLEGAKHSAQFFHGRDGLGEIETRYPDIKPDEGYKYVRINESRPAHELCLEAIHSRPSRSVTYIVLGPMTNLALVTKADPNVLQKRIGRIVSMGGALDVPGNDTPVAEFNFYADPYAVHVLLTGPSPLIPLDRFLLAPLDITTPHELDFERYADSVDPSFKLGIYKPPSRPEAKSPLAHFCTSFFERTRDVMKKYGKSGMELHDIVAVWCAVVHPPHAEESAQSLPVLAPNWKAHQRLFEIERTGELTRGMCVVDRRDEAGDAALAFQREFELQDLKNTREDQEYAELEHKVHDFPAPVQHEIGEAPRAHPKGIAVIVETPGTEALVSSMFERIWGTKG